MSDHGRARRIVGAALLLAIVHGSPTMAGIELPAELPPDSPEIGSAERQALIDFQRDPVANGQALLRVGAGAARGLPLITVLAAGDVHLRAGRIRTATRFFREAARRDAGPPWDGFAQLGLGWTALARRDFTAAAKSYRNVDPQGPLGGIAAVMKAWLAAFRGRHDEAMAQFDRAAAMPDYPPNVRQVALLGGAYTRYWRGAFDEAAAAFDRLVTPPSALSDDARYGAAWSRVRAGQLDAALPALMTLAGEATDDAAAARISEAAVSLTPATVARSGRESTARISGFAGPDARMVAMFDGDGAARARAALAVLMRRGERGEHVVPAALLPALPAPLPDAPRVDASSAEPRPAPAVAARPMPAEAPAQPRSERWGVWWIALGILALAMVLLFRRRPDGRTNAPLR